MPALQVSPRSVAVAAVVLTLLALFASRPASAEGEEPQGLAIEGAGVGLRGARYRAPSDPLPAALPAVVAAVVHNPNVGFAAEGVRVRLTVYDADERAIGGTVFDLPQILPRERRGITGDTSVPRDALPVVRVTAEVEALARWVPVRE